MTPGQFTFWLQGFFEISGAQEITKEQSQIIQDHLQLVFNKVTPNRERKKIDPFDLALQGGASDEFPWDLEPICGTSQEHEDTVKFLRTAVSC